LQTRRGTDWQSEHRKQAQQHDSELDTVYPFDVTQVQLWPRRTPNTLARFASIERSHGNHEVSGLAPSATTPSLVAHGNHSPEPLMQTAEFSDDPLKALQQPIWPTSPNKQLWTMNVQWQQARSQKKSEPIIQR
jgi:hypothetical protein